MYLRPPPPSPLTNQINIRQLCVWPLTPHSVDCRRHYHEVSNPSLSTSPVWGRLSGPTGHWSYAPLVLHNDHWSYGPLILRAIGPTYERLNIAPTSPSPPPPAEISFSNNTNFTWLNCYLIYFVHLKITNEMTNENCWLPILIFRTYSPFQTYFCW